MSELVSIHDATRWVQLLVGVAVVLVGVIYKWQLLVEVLSRRRRESALETQLRELLQEELFEAEVRSTSRRGKDATARGIGSAREGQGPHHIP